MSSFFSNHKEFDFLTHLIPPHRMGKDGKSIGDDGFLLQLGTDSQGNPQLWAISSDGSLEGRHYSLTWSSIGDALEKAILSNLSDINAMGGTCSHLFFHLGSHPNWGKSEFYEMGQKLQELEKRHGFQLCGGDLTQTNPPSSPSSKSQVSGNSFFSFTAMGALQGRPLLRSNARPGHKVYVSGSLGGSASGLALLQDTGKGTEKNLWKSSFNTSKLASKKIQWETYWKGKHFIPTPPLELGPLLSEWSHKKSSPIAAIDISDGLSSELNHIAHQSNVCIHVREELLPVEQSLETCFLKKHVKNWTLHGGEEYQLLFTGKFSQKQLNTMREVCDVTEIGTVESVSDTEGKCVFLERNKKTLRLKARGWGN